MRDLYRRLGLGANATAAEISAALSRCDLGLAEDARAALLNVEHRKVYDANYFVLKQIAALRTKLSLNRGANWEGDAASDFTQTEKPPERQPQRASPPPPKSRGLGFQLRVAVATIAIGLVFFGGLASLYDARTVSKRRNQEAENWAAYWNQLDAWLNALSMQARLADKEIADLKALEVRHGTLRDTGPLTDSEMVEYAGLDDRILRIQKIMERPAVEAFDPDAYLAKFAKDKKTTPPAFSEPEQPMPVSGLIRRIDKAKAVAPLKFESSGGDNHFVKLVVPSSGATVATVFVRAGESVAVRVPLGDYGIRYAAGSKWFGEKHLFGPKTSYSSSDKTFTFERAGNKVSGFTITLYKVENGNLHTRTLRADEF